jgi:polysaccharide export outer membrane protein
VRTGSLAATAAIGFNVLLAQRILAQVTPAICVGVGDAVQVTIFEPADVSGRPGNFVTLPAQAIDASGTFPVPFAGDINAGGRSLLEIRREIEAKLAKRAIDPGVEVALIEQKSTGQCAP